MITSNIARKKMKNIGYSYIKIENWECGGKILICCSALCSNNTVCPNPCSLVQVGRLKAAAASRPLPWAIIMAWFLSKADTWQYTWRISAANLLSFSINISCLYWLWSDANLTFISLVRFAITVSLKVVMMCMSTSVGWSTSRSIIHYPGLLPFLPHLVRSMNESKELKWRKGLYCCRT